MQARLVRIGIIALVAVVGASATMGATPEEKCQAAKLTATSKHFQCRLKALAKAVKKGGAPDFAKCDATFVDKWTKVEIKAGGACPTSGDQDQVHGFVWQRADEIATALAGGGLPPCAAQLAACLAAPKGQRLRTGQTLCYDLSGGVIACAGTGQDGELQRGLAPNFTDNGDGTITDLHSGLMWEKNSDDGSIHDKDLTYTWTEAVTIKLATLNAMAFAGYSDWRLPNIDELVSILDQSAPVPKVFPQFHTGCVPGCSVLTCSCMAHPNYYWSSTTQDWQTQSAWRVWPDGGLTVGQVKVDAIHVRAVRGGS